jgi:hypothetical protein
MKSLTLKEIRRLYWEEKTREACNVFSSSGDDKNEARNMYLAAVDYAERNWRYAIPTGKR